MPVKYFFSGIFVKAITGFDDTMVHIPIMATITRTKTGRVAFAFGILCAITLAIIISFLFGSVIKLIPYFKYISAILVFLLAITIYFDLFIHKPREKVVRKIKKITTKRIFKLIGLGFITAFATVIDDTIAYSALFTKELSIAPYVILGIFSATLIQLYILIYFSKKISKLPYKKQITTIGLIILGFLILFEVL